MRPLAIVVAAWTMVLTGIGCAECPTKLVSVDRLTGDYNTNAAAVSKLWARARIDLAIADDKGKVTSWGSLLGAPNGILLFGKGPDQLGSHDFLLTGLESGRRLFTMGSSTADDVYYLWFSVGDNAGAWFGRNGNAGAPGTETLAVDPIGLISVLGVSELPTGADGFPAVALSMCSQPCAYVLTYIDRQPKTNRVLMKRDLYFRWSDKGPPQVFRVDFYAADGRRIMTAAVDNYQPVPGTNVGGKNGKPAMIPTDIQFTEIPWPGRTSHLRKLHITLSNLSSTEGDPVEAAKFLPNLPANVQDKVVSIDEPPMPASLSQPTPPPGATQK